MIKNFNLGLANYDGDASLITEIRPNSKEWAKLSCPCKFFSFRHIECLHGSETNTSNKTMVSFDFRLALKEIYFYSVQILLICKTSHPLAAFLEGFFSKEVIQ